MEFGVKMKNKYRLFSQISILILLLGLVNMLVINGSGRSPTYWIGWHYPTDISNPDDWYDETNILTYNDGLYGYTGTINDYVKLYDFNFDKFFI